MHKLALGVTTLWVLSFLGDIRVARVPVNSYCFLTGNFRKMQRYDPTSVTFMVRGNSWGCMEFVNDTDTSGPYFCKTRDMRVVMLPNISVHNGYAPDVTEKRMAELYATYHVPKNPSERRASHGFVPEDKMIHVHFQIVLTAFCAKITSSQALQPQIWDKAAEPLGAELQSRVPHGVRTYYVRRVDPPVYTPSIMWHGCYMENVEGLAGAFFSYWTGFWFSWFY